VPRFCSSACILQPNPYSPYRPGIGSPFICYGPVRHFPGHVQRNKSCRQVSSSLHGRIFIEKHSKGRSPYVPLNSTRQLDLQAFLNEVVTWRHLRHPNIVPLLGVCDKTPVCLVSEWMAEGNLKDFLQRYPMECRTSYVGPNGCVNVL
jgi:serine/threonine protein kinase